MLQATDTLFHVIAGRLAGYGELCLVYDRNVRHIAVGLRSFLRGKLRQSRIISVPLTASEKAKNLASVSRVCRALMKNGFGRGALVISLGGGFTSDVAGFAAGIYKRGIAYANLPTTLLSMVDAGIGGKTGVNLDGVKNAIGRFHYPEFTLNVIPALATLPEREFRSGIAEMLKTFIIADAEAYSEAVGILSAPGADYAGKIVELEPLIGRAASIKESIAAGDPEEKGLRRVLNLGHTLGHALEGACDFKSTHGECVAVGIVEAAALSEKTGLAPAGLAEKIASDFRSCGLPCSMEELSGMHAAAKGRIAGFVINDKKTCAGRIKEPLIRSVGDVEIIEIEAWKVIPQNEFEEI